MDIVVCIKQVPETTNVGWNPETGTLVREGVPGVLNPNDKNALEAGLQLKERHGGTITAISMGPAQAEEALREALSMGVDQGILLTDPHFAGADTWATAYTLSLALKKIGRLDLILCGKETTDAWTGQVGPQLAEFLGLPQLTYASEIESDGSSVRIKQRLEDRYRLLECPLPALVTLERDANRPRIPPMDQIMEAFQKEVGMWGAKDLGGNEGYFGLRGSPTQTEHVYIQRVEKRKVEFLKGDTAGKARELVRILRKKILI